MQNNFAHTHTHITCLYFIFTLCVLCVFSDNVAARIDIKIQSLYASLDVYLVD